MDSGNSNSLQSSSGDEDYDSRAESISSFLNNSNSSNNNNHPSSFLPPPASASANHPHHSSLFDPLSSNFTFDLSRVASSSSSNPNSLLNFDLVWSKSLRSEPNNNCTDLGGLFIPSTQSSFSSSPSMQHLLPRGEVTESASKASSFSGQSLNTDQAPLNQRNPRKRSRASRRAPTTVLTTDTSNFRAMVQEFTGIPAPPFTSSSSPFPRTRLDLFGNSSRLTPPSSYNLLRPFAQKPINPSPFSTSNNSMIDAIASATTSSNISNYSLQASHNLLNINMQNNPILNLHSLFQMPTKYPLTNSSILEAKSPPQTQGRSLEELGLSQVAAGLESWHGAGAGAGAGAGSAVVGTNENHEGLGPFANGKLSNFSQVGALSEFHRDKGQENVNTAAATTTRTEGIVESWICSSD